MRISGSAIVLVLTGLVLAALGVASVLFAEVQANYEIASILIVGGATVFGLGAVVSAISESSNRRDQGVDDAIVDMAADIAWLKEQKSREVAAVAEARRARASHS